MELIPSSHNRSTSFAHVEEAQNYKVDAQEREGTDLKGAPILGQGRTELGVLLSFG